LLFTVYRNIEEIQVKMCTSVFRRSLIDSGRQSGLKTVVLGGAMRWTSRSSL